MTKFVQNVPHDDFILFHIETPFLPTVRDIHNSLPLTSSTFFCSVFMSFTVVLGNNRYTARALTYVLRLRSYFVSVTLTFIVASYSNSNILVVVQAVIYRLSYKLLHFDCRTNCNISSVVQTVTYRLSYKL